MRWIILIAFAAFIALWMITSYRRQPGSRKRKLPWPEATSAVIAFAAWGLVMPESPLAAELSSSNQTVWTYIIVAAAVAALGLLTGSMKKPVKKEA